MEGVRWDSDYMIRIYKELGWNEEEYPLTQMGIYCFLETHFITIMIFKDGDKFKWGGTHIGDDCKVYQFSEDLTEYETFDDVINAALMESACYLSLNIKKDNADDTHL